MGQVREADLATQWLPTSWRPRPRAVLPNDPRSYDGPRLATLLVGLYLVVITVRSCIHVFAPDGGAHSIATIDTSVAGGKNIIAIFGQWGAIQLLLAALLWVLLVRYRGFVPLIAVVFLCEPFFRGFAGHLKPIETVGTAPGAALNWFVVPVMLVVLYLSLCSAGPSATAV